MISMAFINSLQEISDGDNLGEGYFNGLYNNQTDILDRLIEASFLKNPAVVQVVGGVVGTHTIVDWINQTSFIKVDVSGSNWDIKLTINSGTSFTTIKTTTFNPTVEVHKTDRNCISIYDGSTIKFFSDDMGSTWNTITSVINSPYTILVKAKMGSGGRLYSIGCDTTTKDVAVSYSDNYGSSWTLAYTSTLLIDFPNVINLEVGDNNTFAYGFADTSADDAETGYSLDSGSTIVKHFVTSTQDGYYGDIPNFIFIDSNNYIIDTRTSRKVNDNDFYGTYILKWNGNVIGSSTGSSWNTTTQVINTILVFSLNYFIYTIVNYEVTSQNNPRLINYSKNYPNSIIMPILYYTPTAINYLGIGTDNIELFADDTYLYEKI